MKVDPGIGKRQQSIDDKAGNRIGRSCYGACWKAPIEITPIERRRSGIGANRGIVKRWKRDDSPPDVFWWDIYDESAKDQLAFIFIAMVSRS